MVDRKVDVVVVGAGLSGVSCARALRAAGASVAVIEARDRVGGRTLSREVDGAVVDLGGQWLGARQPRLEALSQGLGLRTFATHHEGKKVLDTGSSISTYSGTIPHLAPWRLLELHRTLSRVERMSEKIPTDDPMGAAGAAELDAISLQEWALRNVHSSTARSIMESAVRVVFGAEARELSMLYFLYYLRSGGGMMSLVEIENGAQERRFVEGAQQLSVRVAAQLGDDLLLGQPAVGIDQDGQGVTVRLRQGQVRARYAVVALPPALAGRLDYSPGLPAARDQLLQRFPMGATVKFLAFYRRAFWRERGLSGELVCTQGPVSVVFDNTSHDGKLPCLVAFVVGDPARTWHQRGELARRDAVLSVMARGLGPEAAHPEHTLEQDWSTEPFTRGCPVGLLGPGALQVAGRSLRQPVGRIHWAGTETATLWTGYLEGALEAAERAATEVLGRLS